MTTFESVERHRTTDSVVDAIQLMIVERKLEPGAALPAERELAAMLGVGRNALRESLGVLSQRGLVVTRHGMGTFVAEPSGEQTRAALRLLLEMRQVDLVELCDARLLVEPELAALAASRARLVGAAEVAAAYEALETSRADPEQHVQADLAFHTAIAELSGHTVLKAIVDAVREPVTRGMILGAGTPGAMEHSDEQHGAILGAIVAGGAEAAREAMREHLASVRDALASYR